MPLWSQDLCSFLHQNDFLWLIPFSECSEFLQLYKAGTTSRPIWNMGEMKPGNEETYWSCMVSKQQTLSQSVRFVIQTAGCTACFPTTKMIWHRAEFHIMISGIGQISRFWKKAIVDMACLKNNFYQVPKKEHITLIKHFLFGNLSQGKKMITERLKRTLDIWKGSTMG